MCGVHLENTPWTYVEYEGCAIQIATVLYSKSNDIKFSRNYAVGMHPLQTVLKLDSSINIYIISGNGVYL